MFYSQKCFISKCLVCVYVYILNLFTPGYSKNNAKVGIKHQSIKLNNKLPLRKAVRPIRMENEVIVFIIYMSIATIL
jgi:hypothetical protein